MKWIFLIAVSISFTSCSYLTKFYLFNTTDKAVEVTYNIKRPEINRPFVSVPTVHKFKSFTRIKDDVVAIPITISSDSLTVQCTLPPKHTLWIGTDVNFSLKSEFDTQQLKENLGLLTVQTTTDSLTLFSETILSYFETYTSEIVGITLSEALQ